MNISKVSLVKQLFLSMFHIKTLVESEKVLNANWLITAFNKNYDAKVLKYT